MSWERFIPEILLFLALGLMQSADPGAMALIVRGLLTGALVGALWCSAEVFLMDSAPSKLRYAVIGAAGAIPVATLYAAFGTDIFSALDWQVWPSKKSVFGTLTPAQRDVSLLASLGGAIGLTLDRAFAR